MPEVVASNRAVRGKVDFFFQVTGTPVYPCWLSCTDFSSSRKIEGRIRQWMEVKAKRAIPGDVINIVVCGHADPQHLGFYAGYHRIFPFEIDRMLGKFKPGVTVNVISGSAHSVEEEGCELRTAPTKRPKPHGGESHGLV